MKLTPKGMRDIPPDDMLIREEIMDKIRDILAAVGIGCIVSFLIKTGVTIFRRFTCL